MPSSYTTSGVELIGNGEQSGTWGGTTNTNLQIIDRMVSQAGTIALSGTTHTLTISDGVLSDGQYGVLVFGGSPSGTNTVTISPNDAQRTYIVKNDSGQTVTLTQGSGGNVSVANGRGAIVYCDGAGSGAAVVDLTATFVSTLVTLGITASASELNILDGATLSTAELNILDGVTATTAELNILDGVTATASELNLLDGVTWTLLDYNTLTATAAELNQLDGVTGKTGADTTLVTGTAGTDGQYAQWNADGDVVGVALPTLPEADWETGTSTTEAIVSPAKVKAAIEAIAGADTPVTEDPSGDASVVFLNLTEPFYTFAFDSIQPDSSSDRQLFMDVSADNGSSWTTTLAISSLANWQINGGGSGALQLNTETITGFGALAYKSSGSTKTGSIVTPRYSGATVAVNAVRFRWNTGNFRTLTGQRIIRYVR